MNDLATYNGELIGATDLLRILSNPDFVPCQPELRLTIIEASDAPGPCTLGLLHGLPVVRRVPRAEVKRALDNQLGPESKASWT